MQNTRLTTLLGFIMFALLLASTPAQAGRVKPIENIVSAPIPEGLSMDQIRSAMIKAGAIRGWVVTGQEAGHLVATLNLREHMAQVDIKYTRDEYSITYRDSKELKYEPGKIHRNYNSWVANLNSDIQMTLSLLSS